MVTLTMSEPPYLAGSLAVAPLGSLGRNAERRSGRRRFGDQDVGTVGRDLLVGGQNAGAVGYVGNGVPPWARPLRIAESGPIWIGECADGA
jgi:hypothetical protein